MTKYILMGAIIAVVVGYAIFTIVRSAKIRRGGITADAVVSRIEESGSVDSEGGYDVNYTYYVTYTSTDGQTVEAVLDHVYTRTEVGDRIRIKYLPEKPNYAVVVK